MFTKYAVVVSSMALAVALFFGAPISPAKSSATGVTWIKANGQGSCENVCGPEAMVPLSSGTLANGKRMYVCAANPGGQGWRAGFNVEPNWSNACWVGYGGRELAEKTYSCACVD